jgi:hypothetical protein
VGGLLRKAKVRCGGRRHEQGGAFQQGQTNERSETEWDRMESWRSSWEGILHVPDLAHEFLQQIRRVSHFLKRQGGGKGNAARATHLSEVHDIDFGERASRTAHLVGDAAHDGVHDAVTDVRQVGASGCRAGRSRSVFAPLPLRVFEEDSHEPEVRRKNGCSNSSGMEARCFGSKRKQLLRVVSKSGPTWNLCSLRSSPRFPIGTAYSGKLIRVDGLEMAAILMAMSRRWENGAPPYTIWYRMQPRDQTSAARPSYRSEGNQESVTSSR